MCILKCNVEQHNVTLVNIFTKTGYKNKLAEESSKTLSLNNCHDEENNICLGSIEEALSHIEASSQLVEKAGISRLW